MAATQQDLSSRAGQRALARRAALFAVGGSRDGRAANSAVRAMQERLSETLAPPASSGRWSGRSTLLFIVATCGGFWLAVGLALMALKP
ncbi:MAG TPA: hypothetical protein VHY34_11020 [Caulobacteraceae bacterium]|jgi:hypothetical protein|nr:hypothetical protein [Caulobacteraceae bacterium]